MVADVDWMQVLLQCKQNVLAHVIPLARTSREPQPDLGVGAGGDQIKLVDLAAEKAVVEVLLQHDVSFTLVSEESGVRPHGNNPDDCFVTTDPVDGTTNFTHRLPFYCCSVAVSDKPELSKVHSAMVVDLVHESTYIAQRGKGASCNGQRISTSQVGSLAEAVVGLDLNTFKAKQIASKLSKLIQQTRHIRHFGANALELCFVAGGLTDAFVDVRGKLRTTDVAAAFLILKEAGGIVTTPDGKSVDAKLDPKGTVKFVASGNHTIHGNILDLIELK